jgi:putative salt-induced outer membrane protein
MRPGIVLVTIAGLIGASPAIAAPMPEAVAAMLTEAAKSPDSLKAVTAVARSTYPSSAAEIDAYVDSLKAKTEAARQQKLADAGLFDAWSGSGQIGFSKTTGNTRDTSIIVGLNLMKDGLKFRHKLNGQVDRQTSSGLLIRNRYLAGYELNYKLTDRLYAYALAQWDRDTFAGFTRRFSESGGAGYTVLKTDALKLDVTAGPAFRQTRYITGLSESTTTARAGADFSWKIRDGLTFSEIAGVYFNGALNSTTALTAAVSTKLSARMSFDVTHEDKVPPGRVATDTATRVSLVYGF